MLWYIHFSSIIDTYSHTAQCHWRRKHRPSQERDVIQLTWPTRKKRKNPSSSSARRNIFSPACRNVWGQTAFREWRNPTSAELQIQSCRRFTWGHPLCFTLKNKKECVSGRPQRKFKGSVKGLRASSWRFCSAAAEIRRQQVKAFGQDNLEKCFYGTMKNQVLKVAQHGVSALRWW